MLKRLFSVLLMCLLAACSPPTTAPSGPTDDGGWVPLEDDFVLDESSFGRLTPLPVEPVAMSLAEARAQLPFDFAVPAWALEGFVLQEQVEVVQPVAGAGYAGVGLTWLNAGGSALHLQVAQAAGDQPALGAAGSTQAVTVNGQPATLVRTQGLGSERLSLTWPRDGLTYTLSADAGTATTEVLLRMAESVE